MKKMIFRLILVLLLTSMSLSTCLANIPDLKYSAQSKAWKINYSFSEWRAISDESIYVDILIEGLKDTYDFNLWIVISDQLLIKGSNNKDSHLFYSILRKGDIRKERLEIKIPSSIEIGEKFSASLKAQSYNNQAGLFGIRIVNPENTYNSKGDIIIDIVKHPIIKFIPDSIYYGDPKYPFKIKLKNTGSDDALNLIFEINFPDTIQVVKGNNTLRLSKLAPNEEVTYEWGLECPKGEHIHQLEFQAENHPTIASEHRLTVQSSIPGFTAVSIIIGFTVLLIFYILKNR